MILEYPDLISVTSQGRQNMSLVYGDTKDALFNRKKFLSALGIDFRSLVCARQAHGAHVCYVGENERGKGALSHDSALTDTDALATEKKNLPLAVFTADCLPVFLYDPRTPAIAIAHAGWRSSKENIATKTIRLMQDKFNTQAGDLRIGFGPAIRACCYQVGGGFQEHFPGSLTERRGNFYLDLISVNKKQLLDAGVREGNVADSGICTCCQNDKFFSFRKNGDTSGRMISVIMLKGIL